MSGPSPDRRVVGFAWLLALVPFLWLVARFDFVCDDAYISFRYARNFAAGLGLVYNPGVEPVEGYSELLWVLLMSAVEALELDPAFWSRAISVTAGVALVLHCVRVIARLLPGAPVAILGSALFLGALPPLAVWSTGGMATLPFCLALFCAFSALFADAERPRFVPACVAAALAVLLRADGAYFVAALCGSGLAIGLARREPRLARAALGAGVFALVVFAVHVGWRYATYGDWLPNTARVKVGLSAIALERGSSYVAHFLLTFPGVAVALLLPLAFRKSVAWRAFAAALLVFLATAVHAVLVGGDFMCFGRFLVPGLPFAALLLAAGLAGVEGRFGRLPAGGLAAACVLLSLLPAFDRAAVPESVRERFGFRWNFPEFRSEYAQWRNMNLQAGVWVDLGKVLAAHTQPGESIVYGAIGAIGYYSNLFMYDANGLVTREVAEREPLGSRRSPGHDKTVPKEFFKKDRPTYLDGFIWPRGRPLPGHVDPSKLRVVEIDPTLDVRQDHLLHLEPYDGG